MSHPLDDVQNTPWGMDVTAEIEELKKEKAKQPMETDKQPPNGRTNGWRFTKEIPISVVLFLLAQAVLMIVSYVKLNSTVEGLVTAQALSLATAYTKDDARKDRELMDSKLKNIQDKEDEMNRRTGLVEGQVNELRARMK